MISTILGKEGNLPADLHIFTYNSDPLFILKMIFIAVLLPFLEQLENDRKVRENEAGRQLAVPVCDVAVADALHVYEAGAPQQAVLAGVQRQQQVAYPVETGEKQSDPHSSLQH